MATARGERKPGVSVEPYRQVRLAPVDPIIADRRRAAILREGILDPLDRSGPFIVVDLNGLQILTLGAADELFVRWLESYRTPRRSFVLVLASANDEIRQTVSTALRDGRQAAYLLRSVPQLNDRADERAIIVGLAETAAIVGDTSPTMQQTVDAVAELKDGASAKDVADQLKIGVTAAHNRLDELVTKGLLLRVTQPGRSPDRFLYPLSPKALELVPFTPNPTASANGKSALAAAGARR